MGRAKKLAEIVQTPEFRAGVARARAKLDAEDEGWAVVEPRTLRALLAVARAADAMCACGKGQDAGWDTHLDDCKTGRALARLRRVSGVEGDRKRKEKRR